MRAFFYDLDGDVMMVINNVDWYIKKKRKKSWYSRIRSMSIEEVLSMEKYTRAPQISVLIASRVKVTT